jgi:hypothetical protein
MATDAASDPLLIPGTTISESSKGKRYTSMSARWRSRLQYGSGFYLMRDDDDMWGYCPCSDTVVVPTSCQDVT